MNKLCSDVVPILVTYNPDKITLITTLRALLSQVKTIVVVDNGSHSNISEVIQSLELQKPGNIKFLALEHNYGLGKAYNIGIATARNLEADFVLLMDQDSIPELNMLYVLRSAYFQLTAQGKQVGAVGARYRVHASAETSFFVRVNRFGFSRLDCDEPNNFVRADFLISSGSLISINALDHIGEMDSDLFIDHVDTEWCFRAKSKGFENFGICSAIMLHSLGDRQIRIWCGRWRTIPFHQPFRYYYMFRNSALLWQRPYMPAEWKRADRLRVVYFTIFFTLFSPNRIANLRMMIKGLKDGFSRRVGKL